MKTTKFLSLLLICLSIHFTTFADDWLNYTTSNSGLSSDLILTAMQDSSDNMWFSVLGVGMLKFDGTNWTTYNSINSTCDVIILSCITDKSKNCWFASFGEGVAVFDGANWGKYKSSNGLLSDAISDMMQSSDSAIWFCNRPYPVVNTNGGISKLSPDSTFTNYTVADGLVNAYPLCIIEDVDKNIWIGTYGGVSKFDGVSVWTNYTTADGLISDTISSICQDKDGNIWFGSNNKGVSKFDGSTWTSYNFTVATINDIKCDSNGNLWFAVLDEGVYKLDKSGNLLNYTTENSSLIGNKVHEIIQDKDSHDLWFTAYTAGVSKFTLFSVTPDTINISALATDTTISISTFKDWELMLPSSSSSWISLSTTAGTGEAKTTLSILENTDITARTGKIYLMDSETGTIKQTIVVNQSFAVATNEVVNTHLTITPNPVKDAFQVSGLEGTATLSLTDTNGKVVLSKEITGNESISVSSLPQGLYIVKLATANGTVQQKLIKQ